MKFYKNASLVGKFRIFNTITLIALVMIGFTGILGVNEMNNRAQHIYKDNLKSVYFLSNIAILFLIFRNLFLVLVASRHKCVL